MNKISQQTPRIVEPSYFSNWGDLFLPPLANMLLPLVLRIPGITPNGVTLTSFTLYTIGCICLLSNNYHYFVATSILLPLAYIADCMDGQVARSKGMSSVLGDYLDKTLDVLKIYMVTLSLALSVYLKTHEVSYVILGFTACFFFNFRYYVKLETIFSMQSRDKDYLEKSKITREKLYVDMKEKYSGLKKTFLGRLKLIWLRNRSLFALDEAEFVIFTALAALLDRPEWALWLFGVGQLLIGITRFIERGYLLSAKPEELLKPLRK
jgi:phosphatidylglycerophosphate synthase